MRCVRLMIMYRIQLRRFKKYCAFSVLAGFVLLVSFLILDTTQRIVRSRVVEYKRQTTVLNPQVELKPKYDVILSAYMNSGSTFSGRFLGFRPDSFYMYEPLWHLSVWDYYKDNNTICNSRVSSCRQITIVEANKNIPSVGPGRHMDLKILHDPDINEQTVPISIPQRILDHVFNCRLSQIASMVQPGVTAEPNYAGPSWSTFNDCLYKKNKIEKCLKELSEVCRHADHRVAKVLRISVHALETLIKDNPTLKVVHLFRDPRAILHSRIETDGYPLRFSLRGSPEIRSNAKALCDKMASDLDEGLVLMDKYPNQFRFIHYEDIFNNEDSLVKLHTILGMKVTRGGLDRIREAGHVNNPRRYAGERKLQRQKNNAYWWTSYMKWGIIKSVENVCSNICIRLGYPKYNSPDYYKDIDINKTLSYLAFKL